MGHPFNFIYPSPSKTEAHLKTALTNRINNRLDVLEFWKTVIINKINVVSVVVVDYVLYVIDNIIMIFFISLQISGIYNVFPPYA